MFAYVSARAGILSENWFLMELTVLGSKGIELWCFLLKTFIIIGAQAGI